MKEHRATRGTAGISYFRSLLSQMGLKRYVQFCLVGGTGVLVDTGLLWALASPGMLGWNLSLGKVLASEVAIFNNFLWNDIWTFRALNPPRDDWRERWLERLSRLGKFNLICVAGIGCNVLLLNVQVHTLHVNMYAANLVAIVIVSVWNYFINLCFAWRPKGRREQNVLGASKLDAQEHAQKV